MGTKEGGLKAQQTNKLRYGNSYYETIGRMGGLTMTDNTKKRGFASNPTLAAQAGSKGGKNSRKNKAESVSPSLLKRIYSALVS